MDSVLPIGSVIVEWYKVNSVIRYIVYVFKYQSLVAVEESRGPA